MNNKEQKFHFIAIGGVGMSGLAKYLLKLGFSVSGSDIKESKYTKSNGRLFKRESTGYFKKT